MKVLAAVATLVVAFAVPAAATATEVISRPTDAPPDDLGVMGADGVIRSEAEAEAMPVSKPADKFLPQIILKPEQAVARVLGKPTSCSPSKYGRKCAYRTGQVEIVFIDGKADWITYNDPPGVGFYPAAMLQLGVDCPVDINKINSAGHLFTWNGTCPGLHTVVLAPGEGQASGDPVNRCLGYVYIKAKTP